MRFGYTILYVEDVPAAISFYEKGLGLTLKFIDPTSSFAEMDTGETSLALCSRHLLAELGKTVAAPDSNRPVNEIAFVTDDPAGAVLRAVAAGAMLKQAPEVVSWGQTTAYVTDPDGFLIEFCTPMGG